MHGPGTSVGRKRTFAARRTWIWTEEALDAEAAYLMQGNTLCLRLGGWSAALRGTAAGPPHPTLSLPSGGEGRVRGRAGRWQVLRTPRWLICFPRDCPAVQWQLRCLFATAQLRLSPAPPLTLPSPPAEGGEGRVRGRPEHSLAVFICDPRTGRPLQKLNFAAAAQRADWCWGFDSSLALFPQLSRRFVALPKSGPALQISERGIMLEWQGQAWGLKASRSSPLDPFPQMVQQ